MKYIVFWSIYVIGACPDNKPDPWGRSSNISCAVMHYDKQKMQKEFTDRGEAFAFYKSTLSVSNEGDYGIFSRCTDVKIDSFYAK